MPSTDWPAARPQLVGDRFADQPQATLGQPTCGAALVEFQFKLQQVTQPAQQVLLQGVVGACKAFSGVAPMLRAVHTRSAWLTSSRSYWPARAWSRQPQSWGKPLSQSRRHAAGNPIPGR